MKISVYNLNHINNVNTEYTEYTSNLWVKYIKLALTFKFISNFSIIIGIFAYYMDAISIFFILAPLIIVNFLVITLILIFDYDALTIKFNGDGNIFVIFVMLWHILPVFWLLYILQKDDMIKIFHPNFMSIFFKSLIIPIVYYYYEIELKLYGDINYLFYSIIYFILLLVTSFYLYK